MTSSRTRAMGLAGVFWAAAWFCALIQGHADLRRGGGARNLEATYHVLLTSRAILEDSVTHHRLLPSVTLGSAADHGIPWGSAVATRQGDQIYTSFPPAGFLVPTAWFAATGRPSRQRLLDFNVLIGAGASLLFLLLAIALLPERGPPAWVTAGALAATAVSFASAEVFISHGLTYWAASLFQLPFAACLLALLGYAGAPDNRRAKSLVAATIAVCASIDWSGYVLAVTLAIFVWENRPLRVYRDLGNWLIGGCVAAAALLIGQYSLGIDLAQTWSLMAARAQMRSVAHASAFGLLRGYVDSFGGFLLLGAVSAIVVVRNRRRLTSRDRLLLAACVGIMVENIALMQHATEFTFDRLKLLALIVVLTALAWSFARRSVRISLVAIAIVSIAIGWAQFRNDTADHRAWASTDSSNHELLQQTGTLVDLRCVDLYSWPKVRGYLPFLIDRNVVEIVDPPTGPTGPCGRLTLTGDNVFTDLPRYSAAMIEKPDGSRITLTPAQR